MASPIHALPEISGPSMAGKEETHNEANRLLEQGANWFLFKSRTTTAQPGSPADGDCYLLPASSTGTDWAGNDGKIAQRISSAWVFLTAREGMAGYVADTNEAIQYDGASWSAIGGSPSLTQATTVAQSGTPVATSVGYLGSPQMSDQDDYTLTINDAGGHYYHVSATPHTLTIPANASVAFPIGTVIGIVNENGAGAITLAITSDTLRWGSSTGSRTIAANGTATLIKVTSTVWRLTGDGIT